MGIKDIQTNTPGIRPDYTEEILSILQRNGSNSGASARQNSFQMYLNIWRAMRRAVTSARWT